MNSRRRKSNELRVGIQRIFRRSFFVFGFSLASSFPCANGQETAKTLKETLASAQTSLSAGDYESAIGFFEAIQTTFAREPEVSEDAFQIVVTPLHAYAALLTEDYATAIELFETFLERFPDDESRLPFILFNLARSHQNNGDLTNAIDAYRKFVAIDPDRPEAALATLAAADLMFQSEQSEEAFEALDSLYLRQPAGIIRNKARLTALQRALELGQATKARDYMLSEPWNVTDMPELAVLAFGALEMGNALLQSGDYAGAITSYRLVPPYEILIRAQQKQLIETEARFQSRKENIGLYQGGQFWTQFYRNLIARQKQQLDALSHAEDYTPTLHMSLGQAYLLDKRAHEAWIIFETLARDLTLPEETQAEAHYRWILAAIEIGVWEDAFRIAEGFGERFPASPLVPDALYLLATAYQEARKYRDAIEILDAFLEKHSEHRLAPRALFVRGYNYSLLNEPALARVDFDSFISTHAEHSLLLDARYWRAMTFFAEKDYESTLISLDTLRGDVKGHRLEPEVAYRMAATLYSSKSYEKALESIQSYLDTYPYHSRHEEGRVLLGDIQMGRGELTKARTIFASIQPSAGHLFAYSVFQTGKILRAVAGAEDRFENRARTLKSHLAHFTEYTERTDIPTKLKARLSEALYWIGWTHIERGDPAMARQVFTDALNRYGDDKEAEQVANIISALARIEKRVSDAPKEAREAALKEWIQTEKETARKTERYTYFSRLNFYLDSLSSEEGSNSLIFETVETVPLDLLDPEGLGLIAAELVERYPRIAKDYLEKLEDEYPDSPHRSFGYYARAILEMKEGDYVAAKTELARFRDESPMHPLSIKVGLLYAESLTLNEEFAKAQETLEEILTLRHAKGRPHAEALLALSRNAETAGKLERAIPYAQRVYNVYRAYPELAAEAYWMSAMQFEALGDLVAAYKTLKEMLSDTRIQRLPIAEEAGEKLDALFETLPEGALDEPTKSESTPTDSTATEEVSS